MNVTISVVCYKYKALKNGEYPIMLRVCKDGKRNYQSLGISIELDHWDFKKNEPKPTCPNRDYLQKIISDKKAEYQTQVLEFKTSKKNFTASTLIKTTEQVTVAKTVDEFYTELIAHYKTTGKIGNSNIYRDSYNSIKTFKKTDKLDFLFVEIDLTWLNEYEKWLLNKNCAPTTMSLLFRTLRSVFNKAIEQGIVKLDCYPFNSFKISKFNTKTKKRAITKEEIKRIMDLDLSDERPLIQLSKDLFIFSYLQGGINLTDIAHLKYENIANNRLKYIRQKTKGLINIPLQDEALKIIQKYSNADASSSDYIFPILNRKVHTTAIQKYNRIHKIIGKINPNLKLIAQKANIEANLTTYVARHTYATVLKRSGVNTSIISESLGHSSEKVTQIYLDSFENSQIDEAIITETLGVSPIHINSALVSAQNRDRLYWTNIPNIEQPEDRNIFLEDILEDKTFINGGVIRGRNVGIGTIVGRRINGRGVREDTNKKVPIIQCLEVRKNKVKSNCLTTVQKDNVVSNLPPGRYRDAYGKYKDHFRYLTVKEYERLQTLPEGYTSMISDNQTFKVCGMGWTVDVIAHIFSYTKSTEDRPIRKVQHRVHNRQLEIAFNNQ